MEGAIPYRVEYSKTRTAGCKGSPFCKTNKVKIQKSELRFGTWVDTEKIQGWQWRHWGCVTSKVLGNVASKLDGDYDLLDGLEDLSEEDQEKIKRALEEGHIDEADITPEVLEAEKGKEAEIKAIAAEKEQKKLQKEKAKADKKAQIEAEKAAKKAEKEAKKEAQKLEKEAAKALKAKKRKRDADESDADKEGSASNQKKAIKQEDDHAPQANSKARRQVPASKFKKKTVKKEETELQPSNIKNEELDVPKPTAAKAASLDGALDGPPQKGRGKAKKVQKTSVAPTRRSARLKS